MSSCELSGSYQFKQPGDYPTKGTRAMAEHIFDGHPELPEGLVVLRDDEQRVIAKSSLSLRFRANPSSANIVDFDPSDSLG
jgi:hypothetical protein